KPNDVIVVFPEYQGKISIPELKSVEQGQKLFDLV
ncbi:PTS glucose transporter subunit IIA, partial [Enterococcus faecium]